MNTILVVDDEDLNLGILSEWLDLLGYRAMTARNGEEAVRLFRQHGSAIDLVLLDLVMPGMGGGEVFDHLKEIDDQVRVILISGYAQDREIQAILMRGVKAFLQKPFRMESLDGKIRDVLSS